jgi:uncharacterized protein YndB with AHSA1/START domain
MIDPAQAIGAEFREVANRERDGKPARAVIASRLYSTDPGDLWDALTNAERIPRWFAPVSGDLRLGGRYQVEGNAGGTITRCDAPEALDMTWEFGGNISWVTLRLTLEGAGTRLTLEHVALADDAGKEHWAKFGPGAVGVGWDLSFLGLGLHLAGGRVADIRQAGLEWMGSEQGKVFMRACAEAWGAAHIASGEDADTANAMAERTAAAYTGG